MIWTIAGGVILGGLGLVLLLFVLPFTVGAVWGIIEGKINGS